MLQPRQDPAFVEKARKDLLAVHAALDQFDGDVLSKNAVVPPRPVNDSHAAAPDFGEDLIGTDPFRRGFGGCVKRVDGFSNGAGHGGCGLSVGRKQPVDLRAQVGIDAAFLIEPRGARVRGKLDRFAEQRLDALPSLGVHAPPVAVISACSHASAMRDWRRTVATEIPSD
jgi:hypothetical protein